MIGFARNASKKTKMQYRIIVIILTAVCCGCQPARDTIRFNHNDGGLNIFESTTIDASNQVLRSYRFYTDKSGKKVLHGASIRWQKQHSTIRRGEGVEYLHGKAIRNVDVIEKM